MEITKYQRAAIIGMYRMGASEADIGHIIRLPVWLIESVVKDYFKLFH